MIVRTWHGCVPEARGAAFAEHLRKTGEDHAKSVPGNLGVAVRRLNFRGWEHFFFATWWTSLEAVKAFAGEDYQLAVHYPDDERFELVPDPYVFHHQVDHMEPL